MGQTCTVRAIAIANGTEVTASAPLPAAHGPVCGAVTGLSPAQLADPTLFVALTLQVSLGNGIWRVEAHYEPQPGQPLGAPPAVNWSGAGRRARLLIDCNRPGISLGATITTG